MGLVGWFIRVAVGVALILVFIFGLSWGVAQSALNKLDRVLAETPTDQALPADPLNAVQSAGLFIASQLFPLRQPGADTVTWGEVLQDCADCPEIVVIPRGYYLIGSPWFENGRYQHIAQRPELRQLKYANREGPRRLVTVSRPFGVSKYQLTIEEWEAAQADPNWQAWSGMEPMIPDYDLDYSQDAPMTNVDWDEAQAFMRYISAKTGQTYRLPTDAEWEYAARAGTVTAYPWGNEIGNGNATCVRCWVEWGEAKASSVGQHEPNAFGLYDMNGNGFEWTEDCFLPYHDAIKTDTSAHIVDGCQFRSVRGGAAASHAWQSRSAMRVGPHYYNDSRGLTIRLARDITDAELAQ